ncbi:MAG: MotA/TolQ/ExbB proton channel family protein [Polyangiaceae bacterium]|nr:MotA/TolQ/ExbB proton channel family protein [Polyangiaceae bacterium]
MEKILEALHEGAPFSYLNVCVLAFALAIIAERTWYMTTRYRVNVADFMNQIRVFVLEGKVDTAIKLCDTESRLPLLQVVKSGLTQLDRGDDAALAAMDESLADVVPALEQRTPMLWTLANIATLLGLLGTISGLIAAFGAVGAPGVDQSQKSAILARGISEAMYNTFLGLLIAVICMVAHLYLHSRAKHHKHELERSVMKLENLFTLERGRS